MQRVRRSAQLLSITTAHVVLACSGGRDSVALAWVLSELHRLEVIDLTIAHIHHGQHERADDAAEAVRRIGTILGLPVVVKHLDSAAIACHSGVGLEEALRRERYLALAQIAREVNAGIVALAHHQQDQAETLLLHLLRGTGVDGLAGMAPLSPVVVPWWSSAENPIPLAIWRPLLDEPANLISEIACDSDLPIVDDPTNTNLEYRRNAIRHRLLPVIEDVSPGATAAIARSARVIERDATALAEYADGLLMQCHRGGTLLGQPLATISSGAAARVLRAWVLRETSLPEVSAERIDAVLTALYANRGGARIEIGQGVSVVFRDGDLHLDPWENTPE